MTKEKTARLIPNAIQVCTDTEKVHPWSLHFVGVRGKGVLTPPPWEFSKLTACGTWGLGESTNGSGLGAELLQTLGLSWVGNSCSLCVGMEEVEDLGYVVAHS